MRPMRAALVASTSITITLTLGLFLPACFTTSGASANAIPGVRVQAEHDFDCAQEQIRITQQLGGRFEAVGCGHRATYLTACEGLHCTVEEQGKSIPWRARPDPVGTP
jgi:hypothetical protein